MPSNRELFFSYLGLPSKNPMGLEIQKANGIYLYDKQGKKFIDLVSGVSVSNTGHLHPEVVQAIQEQLKKYMHLMVYGEFIQEPQVLLAKLLSDHLPDSLNAVYFVNSGSEAIEGAMKLAKRYTGRTGVAAFKNGYHGGTHGALSILGNELLKNAFRPLLPDVHLLEFNNPEQLNLITNKTACVVAETIQAEAGIILPENSFLEKLRARCDETGALLIIDDVQLGFGRTGKLFSFEHFNFKPDILAIAKGMGGGMPVGAFIASNILMKTLSSKPELGHITTFGGHPVSCAAALANLKVILRDNLAVKANAKGLLFKNALNGHPAISDIRQSGLMLAFDMDNPEKAAGLQDAMLQNGLISDRFLFRPQALRIAPPLTISTLEIEEAIDLILKSLKQLK
ncbi:MAG: aspartate aminotransferase family protein [Bacteroidales bacterium]